MPKRYANALTGNNTDSQEKGIAETKCSETQNSFVIKAQNKQLKLLRSDSKQLNYNYNI